MKKLMTLCLMMMLSAGVFAQEGLKVGISFGPTFNSAKTQIDGQSSDDLKSSGTGYRLALNGTYGFTENVSLYSGFGVVAKNLKEGDVKFKSTYLEIPFGVRMRTSELSSGLYAGALVAPTIDINVSAKSSAGGIEVDAKDQVKTFGSSIKIGAFVEKEFDFGRVFFMPAYNLGITNTNAIDTPGVDTSTRTNYFELSLGFFF